MKYPEFYITNILERIFARIEETAEIHKRKRFEELAHAICLDRTTLQAHSSVYDLLKKWEEG